MSFSSSVGSSSLEYESGSRIKWQVEHASEASHAPNEALRDESPDDKRDVRKTLRCADTEMLKVPKRKLDYVPSMSMSFAHATSSRLSPSCACTEISSPSCIMKLTANPSPGPGRPRLAN